MNIPFTIPQVWMPLIIGLLILGFGAWLVSTKNLLIRLLGLVLALGGTSLALSWIPNSWVSSGIKFAVVIVVGIGLSIEIARSGWKSNRGATITGGVLTVIGVLALIIQLRSYVSVPTGPLQQAVAAGFDSLSRIFILAGRLVK